MKDLDVEYLVGGQLPHWLSWESESALAGTPPAPSDEEGYKVSIPLTATYNAFGMSHVIESRLDLDIKSPGSGGGDLSSSTRPVANVQSISMGPGTEDGMEGGMESFLDDEDDEMGYLGGQHPFSSDAKTPPSAVTPSIANANQLLYVPSHSLQNSPLKQSPPGLTPPPSLSHSNVSTNPLTPNLSPRSLQFNQHIGSTPRQPASAPQSPLGGTPSQLSLRIPHQIYDPNQRNNPHFMNDVQFQTMYGLQNHKGLSPPASTESRGEHTMYGIDEESGDNHSVGHGYFDESYDPLELGSPFVER